MTQVTTIKDVLLQCQTSLQCHTKMIKVLKKIYVTMGVEEFWQEFEQLIKFPMVVFNREPTVERTIDFIAKFISSLSTSHAPAQGEGVEEEGGLQPPPTPQVPQGDSNPLMQRLFDFLLQHHNAKDRAVRFRACQLINKLLGGLGDDASIDDALYERVFHCMLERLRDKAAVVRVHAVLALVRLQDPSDDTCPLIKAYLFLMTSDPNHEVRKAIVQHIAPCRKTLPAILERTHDVKDSVRQAAFTVVAEKIPLRVLSISQRVQLLEQGLNDRAESVRSVCCNKMLQGWLRSFEGNVLDLLHSLDVENSTEVCRRMLTQLFMDTPIPDLITNFNLLNDQCVIPRDKLTCESAMYWRELCSYVHKAGTDYEQHLDMVLTACLPFCDYLDSVVGELEECSDLDKQLELEFIIQQLLYLMSCMDLADQACRKAVEKLLHKMLLSEHIAFSLVKHLLPCLRSLYTSSQALSTYLAETVAEIRQPISMVPKSSSAEQRRKIDLQIAKVRVQLNQAREELEESVKKQEFQKAAEIKDSIHSLEEERSLLLTSAEPSMEEVRIEKNDPVTVVKCLTIICEMLESLPLQTLTPTLQMLMETQILPGMSSQESIVRNLAVKAIGMCCQLNRDIIMQHLPVLIQASQVDVECVRVTALKSLFDLIHIFGLGAFQDTSIEAATSKDKDNNDAEAVDDDIDDSKDLMQTTMKSETTMDGGKEKGEHNESGWSKTASNLVAILTSALDNESGELRSVVAEGLAKLLMSGRVFSASLLSRLLLLWYNPLTEDETALRHMLGTFFPIFAFTNSTNQELFEETFLPTLRVIINAPTTSPLNGINATNVADFLVELTHAQRLVSTQQNPAACRSCPCHDSLAVKVCNEILTSPQSIQLKLWARVLNQLTLSPDNHTHLKDLSVLCQQMLEVVKEKSSIKALEKFHTTVTDLLAQLNAAQLAVSSTASGNQAATPTMPPPAATTATAKTTGRRARGKAMDHSQLDTSLYTTPSKREILEKEMENIRFSMDSLLLDTSKTPKAARTPGAKRALHTIQDTSLL